MTTTCDVLGSTVFFVIALAVLIALVYNTRKLLEAQSKCLEYQRINRLLSDALSDYELAEYFDETPEEEDEEPEHTEPWNDDISW